MVKHLVYTEKSGSPILPPPTITKNPRRLGLTNNIFSYLILIVCSREKRQLLGS
ncbi:MAG: hypothetical protein UV10_C0029G0008 [Candidatus Azambacteria bacterium GW2011_GWA1_42_19]|uniref:Uncharacterized protein n=1 Tax=Candidatus Azambacteria bacterium GW2011_GWA1_42_19 TaxID=1618609 RepID=A0A0G1C6M0_9BACT|nr:MAG: hypothetical protein UV10_C0029G0008 [Candidatus Azambacteria bacterium GW2011_GWA1_42_19]